MKDSAGNLPAIVFPATRGSAITEQTTGKPADHGPSTRQNINLVWRGLGLTAAHFYRHQRASPQPDSNIPSSQAFYVATFLILQSLLPSPPPPPPPPPPRLSAHCRHSPCHHGSACHKPEAMRLVRYWWDKRDVVWYTIGLSHTWSSINQTLRNVTLRLIYILGQYLGIYFYNNKRCESFFV